MKIIVPTDFSKNADKAVNYALHIVGQNDAEIILLHAYQEIETGTKKRKLLFEEFNLSVARKLHDALEVLKRKTEKLYPGVIVSADFYNSNAHTAILKTSKSIAPDYIIMGTQGAMGMKSVFMGSVTAGIIGLASVPVIAVPRQFKWRPLKHILFAVNRFEANHEILAPIQKIMSMYNAQLHVVVFSDDEKAGAGDFFEKDIKLKAYKKEMEKYFYPATLITDHIKGRDFEDALQQYINSNGIDLLAMITYKRNFLEHIFSSSATRKMAYRTLIPLLAIPGTDE